ncbi:hypothetical protein JOE58_001988 [Curtobacterium luteum]|uniref:Uncharacterized protein n=1 Tax=Curtobacterium luteum TaxID=33881 RepID=A0A8H9GBX9_9MICO|nr:MULTISPECIES: hypothetical protein [Curtobacterium]MBM7802737.1 hypothetical protein [Curtobacterium luteum]NUU49320.1 hypothetical protein [Curtobacterium luteum]GGL12892.1 hypothetical protein GCM10009769_33610 [Curtobacterium luteum]
MPGKAAVQYIHNSACESAAQASCHCFCHGAGHQNDLVVRAAKCGTTADFAALEADLEGIFGGFHASFRDVTTPTRGARRVLDPADAASTGHAVGRGATWYETLIVDESLHTLFLQVATTSQAASRGDRNAREAFVERITSGAISVVGSATPVATLADSHVWCSIVSEYLAGLLARTQASPLPPVFDDICYPRLKLGRRPGALPRVQTAGLAHLAAESAVSSLTGSVQEELMRLVAAATCPDLWHHPAVVRFAIQPVVTASTWSPAHSTTIVTAADVQQLERRWARNHHW